jgi:hypothetical protein
MWSHIKAFVKAANFGWLDVIAVLSIGSVLMWLTNRVTGHVCECDANQWSVVMIELVIIAAIIGAVWWKWDVITSWLSANVKDESEDDIK